MIEDRAFNEFLKAKLEEDVVGIPEVKLFDSRPTSKLSNSPTFQLSNSPTFQLSNSPTFQLSNLSTYLLAASLLMVCGLFAVHYGNGREMFRERDAISAIELLDVDSMTASSESYVDRLLAWQDAPYAEILD